MATPSALAAARARLKAAKPVAVERLARATGVMAAYDPERVLSNSAPRSSTGCARR